MTHQSRYSTTTKDRWAKGVAPNPASSQCLNLPTRGSLNRIQQMNRTGNVMQLQAPPALSAHPNPNLMTCHRNLGFPATRVIHRAARSLQIHGFGNSSMLICSIKLPLCFCLVETTNMDRKLPGYCTTPRQEKHWQ